MGWFGNTLQHRVENSTCQWSLWRERENHVCGWKRFHTQLITFLVSQTISTILNPPYSHMGIIQIICFVSDTLSDDQKSKFNFSSTYTQGLRASLGQGYYINSDCLLNNTAFFIVLASEWQGLIIRFDFQTYYSMASWISNGAWNVNQFQNSTFWLKFNLKLAVKHPIVKIKDMWGY